MKESDEVPDSDPFPSVFLAPITEREGGPTTTCQSRTVPVCCVVVSLVGLGGNDNNSPDTQDTHRNPDSHTL